jgi:phosphotriesterase-related protein
MGEIATVTGSVRPDALGPTLMHEHLMIGYPGWESDSLRPGDSREEMFSRCVDRIEELKGLGVTSMLDPCPADLGRDVEFMAKVAQKTSFNIICATGLYKEEEGGTAYWKFRGNFGSGADAMAETFEKELSEGIGNTGIRAGIIKVATGFEPMTAYETTVFEAAAKAAVATGAPVTTHTDKGLYGEDQQALLIKAGVPAHRIIIGHSCGTSDQDYHARVASAGSYLGFDRFGLEFVQPDAERVACLLRLMERGHGRQLVVSHDTVWCWRGQPIPRPEIQSAMEETWNVRHFHERILPRLREGGATREQIDDLLIGNPRRFFAGEEL